jgi:hypothetical protein
MRAVNLLPKDEARRRRKAPNRAGLVALGGAAILAMGLGAAFLSASGTVAEKQDELANVNAQLAAMPKPELAVADNTAMLSGERDKRAAALASALSSRI